MSGGYLGNQHLKNVGVAIDYTPEMVEEYMKCANDPVYFAKKYIKIVHVDRGLIPLEMYDYQKEITQKIFDHRRVICLTSRQAGKTTTAVAVILHYILFNEYKTAAILANKGAAAREVLYRIQLAYEALPPWLQHGILEWNKGSIELENGCKVFAGTTTSSSIRGSSISFLYIDECAFVEGYDEFFASVYPTISSGNSTKLFMTSTPNGLNHFWKTWQGAVEETNGYQYVKVMWNEVPGRDEKWKKETIQALDHDAQKFAVEYECQFLGSSGTLISGDALKELHAGIPVVQEQNMKQYAKPEPGHEYVIISDVSHGKGLDYSVFQVIDVSSMPYRQVMVFRDNFITPTDYASVIYRTSKMYNSAHVLVEVNDIGVQVADTLFMDYGLEELLMTENAGARGKKIAGGFSGKDVDRGIRTTKSVKKVGCSVLKLLIEQKQLLIHDHDTIYELSRFVKKKDSYEAEPGEHDDTVMPLVLFAWLTNQDYFREITDINTLSKLRDKTEKEIEDQMLPFGFVNDGSAQDENPAVEVIDWGFY